MNKLIILLFLCRTLPVFSQNVGIGIDNPSHKLHISATANPLRLEGLQPGETTDSIVTADANGVLRKRNAINIVAFTGWSITGNTGTIAAANFLGTTDNKPLLIRTNNQPSGLIDPEISTRNNSYGYQAFTNSVTGNGNNAFGFRALASVTTGNNNTSLGDSAATNIITGSDNVTIGSKALSYAISSNGNIAIGSNALKNSLSSENIAVGKDAAASNVAGGNILAIGTGALQKNTSSNMQLAIGGNALQSINGGMENTAVGYNAGLILSSSSYNVLVGHYTLSSTTGASNNTVVGYNAGIGYTGSGNTNNTFIGYQNALSQTGGANNTYLGAGVDVVGNTAPSNSSALGQGVLITASNQVRIGNTAVTSIGGQVGWTTFSDARIKKNVKENVPGLSFISKLRPVTYNYDMQSLQKIQGGKIDSLYSNATFGSIRFTGLVAQEVDAAAKSVEYDFSGVDIPANDQTPYGIRYAELVVPLIKAVQEMKVLIEKQQQEIETLKAKIKQ